ncbi:MAG: hypothetical protein K5856_02540 [Bacteroidaceae bacterium]|nr:hypothetical protein [Bacteroidaceae bacterium]
MKKILIGLAFCYAIIMLLACENQLTTPEINNDNNAEELKEVTFSVIHFDQTLRQMGVDADTRATLSGNATYLKVALFVGDTKRYEFAQTSTDEGFGTISAQVVPESYQMVMIASKEEMTIESLTNIHPAGSKLNDSFYYYGTLTKANLETGAVAVGLDRMVARFEFQTDAKPAEVKKLTLELTGGSMTFNAVTGLGAESSTQTSTFDISSLADNASIHCGIYTFLPSAEAQVSVKATAYNASDAVVKSYTFTNVQMKPAYNTYYNGTFFQIDGSWTVTINSVDWNTINVPYNLNSL